MDPQTLNLVKKHFFLSYLINDFFNVNLNLKVTFPKGSSNVEPG
jgi:hypothetical protein